MTRFARIFVGSNHPTHGVSSTDQWIVANFYTSGIAASLRVGAVRFGAAAGNADPGKTCRAPGTRSVSHASHGTSIVNAPLSRSAFSFVATDGTAVRVETHLARTALSIGGAHEVLSDAAVEWAGVRFETLATAARRLVILDGAKAVGTAEAVAGIGATRLFSVHLDAPFRIFAVDVALGTHSRWMASMGVRISDVVWWARAHVAAGGLLAERTSVANRLRAEVDLFTLNSRVTIEPGFAAANGLVVLR